MRPKTKEEAIKLAKALVAELGAGWKRDVWNNLGWCYGARRGGWKVYPLNYDRGGRYHAFLNEAGSAGGLWVGQGATPADAIAATLRLAHEELDEKNSIVAAGEEAAALVLKRRTERSS